MEKEKKTKEVKAVKEEDKVEILDDVKTPEVEDKLIEVKESEHQGLKDELADYKDKYVRLYAEFDNMRKRMEREKLEFIKYANENLIVEFLGVLDNLDRSVAAAKDRHEDYTAFLKGVELVMAQIYEMLKKNHVAPIEALNQKFDPNCHEVLMQEESADVEEGTVIEEFQKGYMLDKKVVRTSKVKLAKNPAA